MLVEIPAYYQKETEKAKQFKELEMELPEGENEFDLMEGVVYIEPSIVTFVQSNLEDGGCLIYVNDGSSVASPMEIKEATKLINEALSK